jgi:hypothetical protein
MSLCQRQAALSTPILYIVSTEVALNGRIRVFLAIGLSDLLIGVFGVIFNIAYQDTIVAYRVLFCSTRFREGLPISPGIFSSDSRPYS